MATTLLDDRLDLATLDVHDGRHVAWWWVEGGTEGGDGMVWEPMYCKRFRYQATTLLAMINASVERQTPEAQKADLIFYDDFRIKPEYIPARWEPRRKARQEDADEPERDEEAAPRVRGSSKDPRPPAGRKKDARKAKQLIKEALRK